MAKLVRVCRNNEDEQGLESHQIPLSIEDGLTLIMEIPKSFLTADKHCNSDGFDGFMKRYQNLNVDELAVSFMVTHNEVMSFLSQTVPCVGCRQSVEKLYNHIMKTNQPALVPLVIMQSGVLTIDPSFLKDPRLLHTFLYCRGSKLNEILESIPKCRRNRRCLLHSLETHKSRTPIGCWVDVWEALSQKCRDEILTIRSDTLLNALENHLRKNRFCTECKRKVLKAFGILTGEIESEKVKGYCASLYSGLKPCPLHKHVHVQGDVEFLTVLLEKAEHELSGMRRERHAKSMDTAQEEVLTCLAVFMWEQLHHLWQKLRTEEQTWQMLFYLGINTLRRSFEVSVEEKQGVSRLEQVVEEIFEEEKVKEVRREQKRQKRRARRKEKCKYGELSNIADTKNALAGTVKDLKDSEEGLSCEHKNDDEATDIGPSCETAETRCGDEDTKCFDVDLTLKNEHCSSQGDVLSNAECHECSGPHHDEVEDGGKWRKHVIDACGTSAACVHKKSRGRNGFCSEVRGTVCLDGGDEKHDDLPVDDEEKQLLLSMGWISDEPCQGDALPETDVKISKEEIQQFKANQQLFNQRQKLREKLREQFNSLSVTAHPSV